MYLSERTEKIKEVSDLIKKERNQYPDCKAIYLFGSFLRKEHFNDIDVLVIYDDSKGNINNQIDKLVLLMEKAFNYPIDMTALSEKEAEETSFLDKLNNNFLRIMNT